MHFCFFIVTVVSCKKDQPVPIESDCANFSYTSVSFQNWPGVDTTYNNPSFNPNNSNEIIYVRGIVSSGDVSLVKRNLVTSAETTILTGIWRNPDWGVKDWILFNHADNQVWKIKSNGDSITLITTDMEGGNNAVWSADGNKIIYSKEAGNAKYDIVTDANGNHLDTLPYFSFYLTKCSPDNKYVAGLSLDYLNAQYAAISPHQTFQPTANVANEHSDNLIFGDAIGWTSDSQNLIWSKPDGIYKTNINSKQTVKIKNGCDSKHYISLSVSRDGKKILAGRIDQKFVGNNILYIKTGFSLIDIYGNYEIKITNP